MGRSVWIFSIMVVVATSASINQNDAVVVTVDDKVKDKTTFYEHKPAAYEELLKQDKNYWYGVGQETLKRAINFDEESRKIKKAKNVILFIGDGMGISTITAARIYKGQTKFGLSGEEHSLEFDKFPNSALVKTYNVDMQVPDSAGTATAIFTGVKNRYKALGVDVNCNRTYFDEELFNKSKVESIMTWAQRANKYTGIVTTTRISHATPAGTYAHSNYRYWECDEELDDHVKGKVKDISRQLIEDAPGKNFKVILGGGQQFLGHTTAHTEHCTRQDGRNLTKQWVEGHAGKNYVLATNNEQLAKVDGNTDYLLGIFSPAHMPYELTRDTGPQGTPSLTDMVRQALKILKKGPEGFVLMVEGGLIDLAHHKNYARLAMEEAAEFDNAISLALNETGPDTLILVTADHSHSFTMEGYSTRGNDILGYGNSEDKRDKPFFTLSYANGPGFSYHHMQNISNDTFPWRDPRKDETRLNDPKYQYLGGFQLKDATHGGEDVAVFAKGPNSNYIRGVIEQNYIAHLISYSGCFGPQAYLNLACAETTNNRSRGVNLNVSFITILLLFAYVFL